jgi:hypothetical protein
MMRNTLPPLASNDLLCPARVERAELFIAGQSARPHSRILQPQPWSRRARCGHFDETPKEQHICQVFKAPGHNVGVDAAAVNYKSIQVLRTPSDLIPLASNDLLGIAWHENLGLVKGSVGHEFDQP